MRATTRLASRSIASTLADLLGAAEALASAHDRLTLPEHEDEAADWSAIVAQVDQLGQATQQLAQLAQESMIPTLKSLKTHAQRALAEIDTLNRLAAA